MVKTFHMSI